MLTSTSFAALAAFQVPDTISSGDQKLLLILALVAGAMVVQALVFVVMAVVAVGTQKKLLAYIEEIKGKAFPIIDKSTTLVTDLTPEIKAITAKVREISGDLAPQIKEISIKVNTITGHVEAISGVVKDKVVELSPAVTAAKETFVETTETAKDANLKARAQVSRVNGMVSSALDATARLGATIHQGIQVPAREVAGVMTGLKVALDTFKSGARAYGSSSRPAAPRPKPTDY
jgi:hypothetical protein